MSKTTDSDPALLAVHKEAKRAVHMAAEAVAEFSSQDLRDRGMGALLLAYLSDAPMQTMATAIIGLADGLAEVGRP
jgi:hypothetical protein